MSPHDAPDRGFRIRGLGEIAIRCDDLGRMANFYGDTLGLDRLRGNTADGIVFFRLAAGFDGHTQVLALFERHPGAHPGDDPPQTGTLHHIALNIPFSEQEAAIRWLRAHGLPARVEIFGWIGWRGVFTQDPEGNTVELVSYSPGLLTG